MTSQSDVEQVVDRVSKKLQTVRVLHVLDHSWPVLSGYSVRSKSIINAQAGIGLEPSVLTGPLHQLEENGTEDSEIDGVQYFRTPLSGFPYTIALEKRIPVLREQSTIRLLRKRILEVCRSKKFDVIHAHSPALCGLAAAQAATKLGLPFVYEIRAFWEDGAVDQERTSRRSLRYRLSRALETRVANRADAVVGIATHILQDMNERGISNDKLFHVPNGVEAARFVPLPRDNELATKLGVKDQLVFGFIGTHYRFEGLTWLVGALAELHRRGSKFVMLMIGDGEEVPEIQAKIRECAAGEYVRLLGRIPHDQIQRYYSVMDVMVYPRRRNRLTELVTPLKPLESMSQCKAVMASDLPALRELISPEENGLLFDGDNIDDFCRQAERLVDNRELRETLGQCARKTMLEEKNWPILAQRYRKIYERLNSKRSN